MHRRAMAASRYKYCEESFETDTCSITMSPLHPTYPAFPIMPFLGFIAPLLPLAWIGTDNTGVILYAIWASLACLDRFINSVVWYGNALNPAPIYCDISSRFFIGVSVALPAASMCIIRRLYLISSMKYFLADARQKRWALIQDLSIVQMALEYTVEGHRFDIYENAGCWPHAYNVWPTYLITSSWPLVLGLIGIIYGISVIRITFRKRRGLNEILTRESIPRHRYNRLVLFACVPMCIVVIVTNLTLETVFPYKGWADTHADYSRVNQIPSILWRAYPRLAFTIETSRWFLVLCSIVFKFFGFFGFSGEAMTAYQKAFWTVVGYVGIARKEKRLTSFTISRKPPMASDVREMSFLQGSVNVLESMDPNTTGGSMTYPEKTENSKCNEDGSWNDGESILASPDVSPSSSDLDKGNA
ncbi:STE3-domain-containing protein [Rickenella mellea]|uniref:STE3-domain-containing protein n=1 Tax=Rickenella mellea TaxID=50990 RepID=A0A4Y7Q2W1_9AGAM|nr:STE3-domain-containing protein [Rickenella mellea]